MKKLLMGLLAVALALVFVRLGLWQVGRANEKQALLEAYNHRQGLEPLQVLPDALGQGEVLYRRVRISGHYDAAHQVLLDNQVYNGVAGYQVLTPFRSAAAGCAVLVNRGWVPGALSRSELPGVALTEPDAVVEGYIERFPRVGLRLSGDDALSSGWPAVAQTVDAGVLSARLGYCVLPYQILLTPAAAQGYVRDWRMERIDPNKSRGYAVQWFALAIGVLAYALWLAFGRRPGNSSNVEDM